MIIVMVIERDLFSALKERYIIGNRTDTHQSIDIAVCIIAVMLAETVADIPNTSQKAGDSLTSCFSSITATAKVIIKTMRSEPTSPSM